MTLKEYFKNLLLKNLHEGNTRIHRSGGTHRYIDPSPRTEIDPIDPLDVRAEKQGIDSTIANIIEPKRLMGRDFELANARRKAAIDNAVNKGLAISKRPNRSHPQRSAAEVWANTRFVPDAESSSAPTEEEIQKTLRTRNLLDTVHHFSREHDIELKPEHIAGIDFSDPDINSHIAEITRRLLM